MRTLTGVKRTNKIFAFFTLLSAFSGWSQSTIFTENMGTPGGTVTIAANTFQNSGTYTYSGTADVRNTTVSSGYTGASGGGNVFFTNTTGKDFQMSGINTTGFTSLTLSLGHYKSTTGANNELVIEVSSDGTTYSPLSYTRITGAGTATWALITPTGTIPATANLRIRFRQTSASLQFRVDDIKLTGIAACTPGAAPTTLASAFSATTFCTSAQLSFTAGNGNRRIAVVSTTNFSNTPANGTGYTANTVFGSGGTVGAGNYVVLNGTGSNVTITGLTSNTTYYVKVFEYNFTVANCDESYLTAGVSSFSFSTQSACSTPQIRSVLVDACTSSEGIDELVIIENGAAALPISDIVINFPSGGSYCNSGCTTNTLGNNSTYINQLNAQAGCTLFQYADPIPAGGIIVVFTGLTPSYVFDYSSQCPSSSTYYAVFCNNASTAGRFANGGTGTRTLDITFGANSDQVTYDLSSTLGDGTFVDFTPDGTDTYRQEINCIYPLGVEWGPFTAHHSSEGIALSWETLRENNTSHFSIEHADFTGNFTEIGTIKAAGHSSLPLNYSFTDREPATGLNYYRLKQWDLNNVYKYSDILSIAFESEKLTLHYFQDQNQLAFTRSLEEGTQIAVYQTNGQLITQTILSVNCTSVPMELRAGIFLVRILQPDGKVYSERLIVY